MWQDWELGWIPDQAGEVKPCSGDVAVRQPLSLTSASPCSDDHDLLIKHTFRGFEAVNPDVTETRRENLTAFGQSVARDYE
jgi:hypothetical protein